MSKHSSPALTMRDALYEAPGPKMRAKIRIGTAISLVAVAVLVALVLQRFYVTGQLSVHYWYFFTHLTTWKFLLAGFEGTVKVALTAGAIALVLGFFVPNMFTAIAFDSGGVASGPMTATFLLPFAMGACEAVGGNILTDAFGIVAMEAMMPLLSIQMVGFYYQRKARKVTRELESYGDCDIIELWEEAA